VITKEYAKCTFSWVHRLLYIINSVLTSPEAQVKVSQWVHEHISTRHTCACAVLPRRSDYSIEFVVCFSSRLPWKKCRSVDAVPNWFRAGVGMCCWLRIARNCLSLRGIGESKCKTNSWHTYSVDQERLQSCSSRFRQQERDKMTTTGGSCRWN